MSNVLVSVIIPFYNTQSYLPKCVASVIAQTYPRIELILIDDGSTDDSGEIALEYSKKHENIILRQTANKGPGYARNIGISIATGEFLIFVDSDDYIAPTMVENMAEALERSGADIVMCKFELFDEHQKEIYHKVWGFPMNTINGLQAVQGMYTGRITVTVWGKIFRHHIIENITFPTGMIYEDRPFMLEAFSNAKKVYFIDKVLLHILKRENSLTRSPLSAKRIADLAEIYRQEIDFAKKRGLHTVTPFLRMYHLSWLRTSFFMLQKHEKIKPDLIAVRPVLMEYIKLFYGTEFSKLRFKGRIHLLLLRLPELVGWKTARFIMNILYAKRTP